MRLVQNLGQVMGYVGVGIVEEPMVKVDHFLVDGPDGNRKPIIQVPLKGENLGEDCENAERAEYLVGVRWLKTVPLEKAIREKGFFGNQNTVARPTKPKWNYTVQRLRERFGIT